VTKTELSIQIGIAFFRSGQSMAGEALPVLLPSPPTWKDGEPEHRSEWAGMGELTTQLCWQDLQYVDSIKKLMGALIGQPDSKCGRGGGPGAIGWWSVGSSLFHT